MPMPMPEEKKRTAPSKHALNLTRRELLTATGVLDVVSFDEESVIAETELGMLIIRGRNLHVKRLNLENGEFTLEGQIGSMAYEEAQGFGKAGKSSLLGRLFR